MATNDCKSFIENCGENFDTKSKWKRLRKYKEGDLILRDFENQFSDKVTVAEDTNQVLSLYAVEKNSKIRPDSLNFLNREKLLFGFLKAPLVALEHLPHEMKEYLSILEEDDSFGSTVVQSCEKWLTSHDDNILVKEAKKIKTFDDPGMLFSMIMLLEQNNCDSFVSDIHPNKVGVVYDKENIFGKLIVKEDIAYILLTMGGDWEIPVNAYIFWSEKDNRLKGFFPTGEGNLYNQEANTAYGSEVDYGKHGFKYNSQEYTDFEKRCEDKFEEIYENEEKYLEVAQKAGFKQFKNHVEKLYDTTSIPSVK